MLAIVADLLTFSRLIAAGILIFLGLQGPETLSGAVLVGLAAWGTDQLDGFAARRATRPTRLAPFDFAIDTVLYAATLAYLTIAGYVPALPALVFAATALVLSLVARRKAFDVLVVRIIDLVSLFVIFKYRPLLGVLLVIWLAASGLIYRRRIAQRLPVWLGELARLAGLRGRV